MSEERRLRKQRILLEFLDHQNLLQSHFVGQKKYGSAPTISRVLNSLGDRGIVKKKPRPRKGTHVDVNIWVLEENVGTFKLILNEFLESEKELRKEFLNHDYFWRNLARYKNEIDLPLFWRIAGACLSHELGLKFALSDLNIKASESWISAVLRVLAGCSYGITLTEKDVICLQRLCFFPRALSYLIGVCRSNKWLDKPFSFFAQKSLQFTEFGRSQVEFDHFAEPFIKEAYIDLAVFSNHCQEQCRKLLDLINFRIAWVRSVFEFSDHYYLGMEELPHYFNRIDKEEKYFCPQCRKRLILSFAGGLGWLPENLAYSATICGYCRAEFLFSQHSLFETDMEESETDMEESETDMEESEVFKFYPTWGADKETYSIWLEIREIEEKIEARRNFVAINAENAESMKLNKGDTAIIRKFDISGGKYGKCIVYPTEKLEKGTVAVFWRFYIQFHEFREPWEYIWIYKGIKDISKILKKR